MVFSRLLVNSFAFALAEASAAHGQGHVHEAEDSEGLHLLQTSAHAKVVSAHNATTISPACEAAKGALKAARQAKAQECSDEPAEYVAPPETSLDKYKIFPPPEEGDPEALRACGEGWMAHTTQAIHTGGQCWELPTTVPGVLGGGYKVGLEESRQLTPQACVDLVFKISRETGLCNPKYTAKSKNLPANYQFTGCTVEFHDQSSHDVLVVPPHLLDEWKYNNLRGHTKFGRCIMCGKGRLGDGNLVIAHPLWKVPIGKAGLIRRDSLEELTRMTCIMNPEEKDGFVVHQIN